MGIRIQNKERINIINSIVIIKLKMPTTMFRVCRPKEEPFWAKCSMKKVL